MQSYFFRSKRCSIIYRENKMFTVTYKSFLTELEAENYRKNIQKSENPDAWVFKGLK